ncbi:DMT family transporter [Aliamphritea hakodatensis]|uniref:DMT family transporter n=1 Tax=Aliamphritea hakodatensis TaxID=2895352 RepID=UPI0022FD6BF7|nr:DMT family transporter [Aliamphritea hakodatensis]
MNQSYLKGALLILAAGLCYAFQPIFAKVAYEDGANAIALMLLRFLLAACLLHLYVFRQRKRRPAAELTRTNVVKILAVGMLVGVGAMCYFMSLERLSIGLATLLFYMFPLYIFVFSVILRLETMSLLKLAAVLLAIGGVYISVDLNGDLPVTGILLGLFAGAIYGIYIMLNNHFLAHQDTLSSITWVSSGAFVCFAIPSMAGQAVFPDSMQGYGAVLGLVFISTLLSLTLFLKGIRLIARSTDTSVLAMTEIGTTMLLAWLLLNEQASSREIIGAVVIFIAALMILMTGRKAAGQTV